MIDKGLYGYKNKFSKGGGVQLELPLDNPNDNIINLTDYLKPSSPIFDWYKGKLEKGENIKMASIDDIAPYLSKFYSEKQLDGMSEKEMLEKLEELIINKAL